MDKPYIDRSLTYTDDGRLLDENGAAIMMDWEEPIMEKSAEIICRNGGRVLNVGFGMGFIDTHIEKQIVTEHWIIETHLDVYTKMLQDGWHLKPHVKILYGDWRWYLQFLPKFDGIYIDTWDEDFLDFHRYIPNILKPDGIFSFFNNPREDENNLHITQEEFDILDKFCTIEFEEMGLTHVDDIETQNTNGGYYWHPTWKTYYCPVLKLK